MKVRTLGELTDALSGDLALRKRELTSFWLLVSAEKGFQQEQFARAGVCLLYAHWEGAVRTASNAYVSYISYQGIELGGLSPELVAVAVRRKFPPAEDSSLLSHRIDLVRAVLTNGMGPPDLPRDGSAISTESNVKSKVLRGVVMFIGADYARYATKEKLLDEKLLAQRNRVAHGHLDRVSLADYALLHKEVGQLMEWIFADVLNSASVGKFKR